MTKLWPRLPEAVARAKFESTSWSAPVAGTVDDPAQIFAPIGGRIPPAAIAEFAKRVRDLATIHGFPAKVGDNNRIDFDRSAAPIVRASMDISWAEAGSRDVWSFIALVVLPDVTEWRFGHQNLERWVGTDLTRHTWARLWWHAVVFDGALDLLHELSESDLNQLLERRSIGGDPRLVRELARAVVAASSSTARRRELIRDATARLRRTLAFMDPRSMDDSQIAAYCARVVAQSVSVLA